VRLVSTAGQHYAAADLASARPSPAVGIYQPQDVRPILKAYQGKDVAAEYNKVEAQRRELEYNTWAATPAGKRAIAKGEAGASGSSWSLSSLFGGQPPAPSTLKQDKPGPPPSYLDTKRGQAQAMYLQEQKYWKDNEAEIKKMMDEDRERQLKEMGGGTVLGMLGALSGAGGPPKADEQQPPAAK
jgi:import inner membrane translocase subunit TIM50